MIEGKNFSYTRKEGTLSARGQVCLVYPPRLLYIIGADRAKHYSRTLPPVPMAHNRIIFRATG